MTPPIRRRDAIRAGIVAMSSPLTAFGAEARGVRSFTLTEPAGLRRAAEPIATLVPGVEPGRHLRLVRDGRPILAQFRPIDEPEGRRAIALDFAADLGPAESARYEVHFGPDVRPFAEAGAGLSLERVLGEFRIARERVGAFTLADDLVHFLRSTGPHRLPFVRDGSPGLVATLAGGEVRRPGQGGMKVSASVVREGPMAIGLRFAWTVALEARSVLDLAFPLTRDRVQASWLVHDPGGRIETLGLDIDLDVDRASLRVAGDARTPSGNSGFEVIGDSSADPPIGPGQGWARIGDDRRRAVAAVADFGRSPSRDRIAFDGTGRLSLSRRFSAPATDPRRFVFCLEFAPATFIGDRAPSPHAILDPIRIAWDRPRPS